MRFQSILNVMMHRIEHPCSFFSEFIKLVAKKMKCSASLAFYLFYPTRLINSINHPKPGCSEEKMAIFFGSHVMFFSHLYLGQDFFISWFTGFCFQI